MTPRVLLLGGVDPSGGAGLTIDATVVALHHGEALPVPLVITEQNRHGFHRQHPVRPEVWCRVFESVLADGPVHAAKVGLIGDAATVRTVARELTALGPDVPILVDPVLSATAGGYLAPADLAPAYREHLVGKATLFTPNVPELLAIFGGDAAAALAAGARAVLVKGGHAEDPRCEDVLFQGRDRIAFARERLVVGPVRGTGCVLASAIATRLAAGASVGDACRHAGDWLAALLRTLGPPVDGLPRRLPLARIAPRIERS